MDKFEEFYVVGGLYTDTTFRTLMADTEYTLLGPMSEAEAKTLWAELSWKHVDTCCYFATITKTVPNAHRIEMGKQMAWIQARKLELDQLMSPIRAKLKRLEQLYSLNLAASGRARVDLLGAIMANPSVAHIELQEEYVRLCRARTDELITQTGAQDNELAPLRAEYGRLTDRYRYLKAKMRGKT